MATGKQARSDDDIGDEKRHKASTYSIDVGQSNKSLFMTASGKPVALNVTAISKALDLLNMEDRQKASGGRHFSAPRTVQNHQRRGSESPATSAGPAFLAGDERESAGRASSPNVGERHPPAVQVDDYGFELDWENVDIGELDSLVHEAMAAKALGRSGCNPADSTALPASETAAGLPIVTAVPSTCPPSVAHGRKVMEARLSQENIASEVPQTEAMWIDMPPACSPAGGHQGQTMQFGRFQQSSPAVERRWQTNGAGSAAVNRAPTTGSSNPLAANPISIGSERSFLTVSCPEVTPAVVDGGNVVSDSRPASIPAGDNGANVTTARPLAPQEGWKEGDLFKNSDGRMVPLSGPATKIALIFFGSEDGSTTVSDCGQEHPKKFLHFDLMNVKLKLLKPQGTQARNWSNFLYVQDLGERHLEPCTQPSSSMANHTQSSPHHHRPRATMQVEGKSRPRLFRPPGSQPGAFKAPRTLKYVTSPFV